MFWLNPIVFINLLVLVLCTHPLHYTNNTTRVKYLRQNNFTEVLSQYKLAVVNFYADWCRFCHLLKPVLEETAAIVDTQYPQDNQVVVAQINCDEEPRIRDFFHITKYPTLKIIRNGLATRSEYRSQRTTEALLNFIAEELKDPVMDLEEAPKFNVHDKTLMLGRFNSKNSPEYELFSRVCSTFNHFDVCKCFARFRHAGLPDVTLQTEDHTEAFQGVFDRSRLVQWFTEKCVPLVREITYENAEEISEEGRPLLILCHRHGDLTSVAIFKRIVRDTIGQYAQNLSFVTADDLFYQRIFYHHLHLSSDDLPVLRLDDYKHIYRLPSLITLAENPSTLVSIVEDYFSGKLHADYHDGNSEHCDRRRKAELQANVEDVFPIYELETESMFRNLTPSKLRYTLLKKEEL